MISVVPAEAGMLLRMRVQRAQALHPKMTFAMVSRAIETGQAWAAVDGTAPLALGGLSPQTDTRAVVWGVLSDSIGANMTLIHREVRRRLAVAAFERIEAHIALDHDEGHRWIRLLGFEQEGVMRKFFQGRDFALYARVR